MRSYQETTSSWLIVAIKTCATATATSTSTTRLDFNSHPSYGYFDYSATPTTGVDYFDYSGSQR